MNNGGIDLHSVVTYLGYIVMGLLTFLSAKLWNDVEKLKGNWLTREEFGKAIESIHTERESKHQENLGNFGDLHEKVNGVNQRVMDGQVSIERRMGEILASIAALRPQRQDGPERRRGY